LGDDSILTGQPVEVSNFVKYKADPYSDWGKRRMNPESRLITRTALIGLGIIALTALSLRVLYGPRYFPNWPWFQFSLTSTIMTCLWAYAMRFARMSTDNAEIRTASFVFMCNPIELMLLKPSDKSLGWIHISDPHFWGFLILLGIVHGTAFYLLQRAIGDYADMANPAR
jgi:hypothetical protein